ncbi:hypothetical protein N665_1293s0011 [Sinapis alba]|nr:hypothetical protein N665_1293s0011 [Sinapis alba]
MASRKVVDTGVRDLISSLPDEVLGNILSLVPTKLAASTSVLSKRWKHSLSLVNILDFDDSMLLYPNKVSDLPRSCFFDFVDNTLALLVNSQVKKFTLKCRYNLDTSRVDRWIRTVLERGFLELHLTSHEDHCIDSEFFTSNTLVNLTLSHGFYLEEGGCLPNGSVFFPALKTLTLIATGYGADYMFDSLISGCPVLEELFIRYGDGPHGIDWIMVVSGQSIKRLTISSGFSTKEREFDRTSVLFEIPNLLFLDYSGYVLEHYTVDFSSLLEATLDLRLWESPTEFNFDYENDVDVDDFGDATTLVVGLSNVKTLHLSSYSLEVLHSCCSSIPLFSNLTDLSFESDEQRGWQVLPLLLKNSLNLETLVIKGLVHKVTDKCGDACACILQKKEEEECCLWGCQVKVLEITGYGGSCKELKQMEHFLEKLKRLEIVKVGVQEDNNNHGEYLRVTNDLMKLPRVSSKCQIQFYVAHL